MNAKKHILVVEDEPHLAIGIRFNLEAEGYHVTVAGDGQMNGAVAPWKNDSSMLCCEDSQTSSMKTLKKRDRNMADHWISFRVR